MKTTHKLLLAFIAIVGISTTAIAATTDNVTPTDVNGIAAKYAEAAALNMTTKAALDQFRETNSAWFKAAITNIAAVQEKPVQEWLAKQYLVLVNPKPITGWTTGKDIAKTYCHPAYIAYFATPAEVAALEASDEPIPGSVDIASRRLNNPSLATDYFQKNLARGALSPAYQKWFKNKLRTLPTDDARLLISEELKALVSRGPGPLRDSWLVELRATQLVYNSL